MRKKKIIEREKLLEVLKAFTMQEAAKHFGCCRRVIQNLASEYGFDAFTVSHGNKEPFSDIQKEIVAGIMLGDANIHRKGYLQFKQVNSEYAVHVRDKLSPWTSAAFNTDGMMAFYTYVSPYLKAERQRWYPDGIKIVPPDIVLSARSIAYWYMDDGSNNQDRRQAVLYTNGFTYSDVELLKSLLIEAGFRCGICMTRPRHDSKRTESYPVLRISSRSYFDFLDFVRPFICESMLYKTDISSVPYYKKGYGAYKLLDVVDDIRRLFRTGKYTQKALAEQYGVNPLAMCKLLNNQTYKEA